MKVLAATITGQTRSNDFSWTVPGELAIPGYVCDTDRRFPNRGCGCGRAFTGLDSRKSTTTAEVVDVDMTREQYAEVIQTSDTYAGFDPDPEESRQVAEQLADFADGLAVGTIVRRNLDEIFAD